MTEHRSPIPGRIYNAAVGGHVCGPEDLDFGQKVVHLIKYDRAENEVSFESQVTQANKIYVIHDDFVLSSNVTIPANCMLEFDGGSINGDYTITGTNTCIKAPLVKIFGDSIIIAGTWNVAEVYPEWYENEVYNIAKLVNISKRIIFSTRTYEFDNVIFPENCVYYFNNTTFKRKTHPNNITSIVYFNNCVLYGKLVADGDKENAIIERERGLFFGNNVLCFCKITSTNSSGHGVVINGDNNYFYDITSNDNGRVGGSSGDGNADGIYILNANNVKIDKTSTYRNRRNGISVTTYDNTTESPNSDLSQNVYINNIDSFDNTYIDIDCEITTRCYLENIRANTLFNTDGRYCSFIHINLTGLFYATNSNNTTIIDCVINTESTGTAFQLSGTNSVVKDISVTTKESITSTGNKVVIDGTDAIIENLSINRAFNGLKIGNAKRVYNININNNTNRYITYGGSYINTSDFYIDNRILYCLYSPSTMLTGNIKVGTVYINENFPSYIYDGTNWKKISYES